MGRPSAVYLYRILARLRQKARIGCAIDLSARSLEPVKNPGSGGGRIDLHTAALSGERVNRRSQSLGRLNGHLVAEMPLNAGDEFSPVDPEADRPVQTQDRERQR